VAELEHYLQKLKVVVHNLPETKEESLDELPLDSPFELESEQSDEESQEALEQVASQT
jgi:hypothetical protein